MVSKEGLVKFKILYKQQFGVELTDKEVIEKATRLLNLYKVVYQPESNIKISKNYEKKIQSQKNS
ncbi:MAG: hypothetical protein ABIE03_06240 [Patescibacteria group bacterium]